MWSPSVGNPSVDDHLVKKEKLRLGALMVEELKRQVRRGDLVVEHKELEEEASKWRACPQ